MEDSTSSDGGLRRRRLVPYSSDDDDDDDDDDFNFENGDGDDVGEDGGWDGSHIMQDPTLHQQPSRYQFPQSWGRGESQFRGNYVVFRYHFGLTTAEWTTLIPKLWERIFEVLKSKDNRHVINVSTGTMRNVEACCRMFFSFMVKVLGYSKKTLVLSHLIDPCLLNKWWVFCATPAAKGGRGSSRDTMRLLCNSMTHLHLACRALGVPPLSLNGPSAKMCNR